MNISSNFAVLLTLGETQKNNKNIDKLGKIVASGQKINSAQDDASAYSISEKMRSQLRSLNQDIINSKNGRNMVNVAEGAVQNIVDILKNIKERTINSANDSNTDEDRLIIQKEVDQYLNQIDDIAFTTNYNGRFLLRGDYFAPVTIASVSDDPIGSKKDYDFLISGTSDYTITSDGVYAIDDSYKGTINVESANVKLISKTSGAVLSGVYINCTEANNDLWVEDLNIDNSSVRIISDKASTPGIYQATIQFSGKSDNQMHVIGENSFISNSAGYSWESGSSRLWQAAACIDMGGGLTITGAGENAKLYASCPGVAGRDTVVAGAAIGVGYKKSSSGSLTITGLELLKAHSSFGAAIGTGMGEGASSVIGGDITIDVRVLRADVYHAASIGTGHSGTVKGNITVTADDIYMYSYGSAAPQTLGKGYAGKVMGTVTLNGENYIGSTLKIIEKEGTGGYKGGVASDSTKQGKPLIIHTGTKSSEQLNLYINDMSTKAMGIDQLRITTQEQAENALSTLNSREKPDGIIDKAIEYALGECTRLGAYHTRLGFTIDNLTTTHENTTAADSVIRDADMAKSMTEYTKANVLGQASQSMLAQANQNMSNVLNLLQK